MAKEENINLFDTLEERLDRILEGFTTLKEENERLASQLREKELEVDSLANEISLLKNEKSDARKRIERLIQRLEGIPLTT